MSTQTATQESMASPEGEPITVIEYQKTKSGWKPHSVVCGSSEFDVDWCQQDQALAYYESGSGADGTYELVRFRTAPKLGCKLWYDRERIKLMHEGKPIADKEARQLGYQILCEPLDGNPFDDPAATEDNITYCTQCGDDHPEKQMCRHVQWQDGGCGYSLGCGAEDVDFNETQVSLYRLLRMLPPARIPKMRGDLLKGRSPVSDYCGWLSAFEAELNHEERYWPGIAWLYSLDSKCRDALALTIGWLWMFERAAWRACSVIPTYRFIRNLPMKELDGWLALDPLAPRQLHARPLRVKLGFEARSANDTEFLKVPLKCKEITLWPPPDSGKCVELNLTLSVAEIRPAGRNAVELYFGAVIERNGKHVSELDGYREPFFG